MFWLSLIVSGAILLIANVLAFQKKLGEASAVGFFGIVGGLLCAGPAIALTCLLTGLGGLVLWFRGAKPHSFLIYSLTVMVLSHLIVCLLFVETISESKELRRSYPSQSLASRLRYESKWRETKSQRACAEEKPINAKAQSLLEDLEENVDNRKDTVRIIMLERLHENVVEDFIDSPGFGIARRIRPRKDDIDLPEPGPISFPATQYDPKTGGTDLDPIAKSDLEAVGQVNLPGEESLLGLHRESLLDFVNPQGFGYVKDREHVRGFQSHQFHSMPSLPESRQARWLIQRVELVSLLTHEDPVVYLSDHLPRMDELRGAPTRPLSDFEKQALDGLRHGADLKVESSANRIQVLGSIRAVKHCVKCHDVCRGELLGAFSYSLKRDSVSSDNQR